MKPNESEVQPSQQERSLRLLVIEDERTDYELYLRQLTKAELRFESDFVQTQEEFLASLDKKEYDIVLADYRLGDWTGMDALRLMRQKGNHTPFILLSGVLGDELAVDCIKQGASDYVLKSRLARLPLAISRALDEKRLIEQRTHATDRLRENEEKFRTLAETIPSAILIFDGKTCLYANRASEVITGYSRDELLGMGSWEFIHPESRNLVLQMELSWKAGDNSPRRYEVQIVTKSGEGRWLDVTWNVVEIEGKNRGLMTAFDITKRKQAEQEIRELVGSDPLTGLANYRRLLDAFDSELERSRRTGRPFALILFDLDGLKKINDAHGHLVGSRALCRVSSVLRNQSRGLDTPARYGGDEFALVLPETPVEAAMHLANRIAAAVRADAEFPPLSVSFGVAVYPEDGESFRDILRIADGGLYLMKGQQRWEQDRRFEAASS